MLRMARTVVARSLPAATEDGGDGCAAGLGLGLGLLSAPCGASDGSAPMAAAAGGARFSVTCGAPSRGPSMAPRAATDFRTVCPSMTAPTRKALAGLPSTAISATPSRAADGARGVTTPISWKRASGAGSAAAAATWGCRSAPSRRLRSPCTTGPLAATGVLGGTGGALTNRRKPQNSAPAATRAQVIKVHQRANMAGL